MPRDSRRSSDHPAAAPPDAAGTRGAYTRPPDVLTPERSTADPPLDSDVSAGPPARHSWLVVLLVLALVALSAFFFAAYLP